MLITNVMPYGGFAEDIEQGVATTVAVAEETEEINADTEESEETAAPKEIVIVENGELFPVTAIEKVAENNELELYVDEATGNIRVVNKKSKKEWLGAPQVDTATLPNNKAFMDSPIHIEYTDGASISQTYSLKDKTNEISISNIEDGVRVDFNINEIKIAFSVEYLLMEDGVEVRIVDDSLKENGNVRLTSLEVLPFFHAADRRDEGAIFVPDGSGALMTIEEKHPTYFKGFSEPVYGPDHTYATELGEVMADGWTRASTPKEKIALPVFGIYRNGSGYLAVITEGEETAYINATPSGIRNIPMYRAGAEFFYRKQDVMFIGTSGQIPLFQGQRIEGERKVRYILLEDEKANYVGMAHAYREYLQEKTGLEKSKATEAPLHIELVGGILRDEIIGTTFIDMTTFDQAKAMISDYADKGIKELNITFKGWSKNGLYGNQPDHFPVERKLGGKKKLTELASHAKEKGINLYLDANYARPFKNSKGLKARKDAVRGN